MDFQSALETFAEAWLATNTATPLTGPEGRSQASDGLPSMVLKNTPAQPPPPSSSAALTPPGGAGLADQGMAPPSSPRKGPPPSFSQEKSSVTSIPIRYLVEMHPCARQPSTIPSKPSMGEEKYAILPSSCLFSKLVPTTLMQLGYSPSQISRAKGYIQLPNWKPLLLSDVSDSEVATLAEVFLNVSSFATLKIYIPNQTASDDLKDRLLELLLSQSQDLLRNTGCPVSKESLESAIRGGSELPDDIKQAFYKWCQERGSNAPFLMNGSGTSSHLQQQQGQQRLLHPQPTHHQPLRLPHTNTAAARGGHNADMARGASLGSLSTNSSMGRSRLRISFDPDHEVPRLNRWFAECQHPSRQQMTAYLAELNSHPCRQNIKHLDLTNIMYWFKNARAAARRVGRVLSHDLEGGDVSDDDKVGLSDNGQVTSLPAFPRDHGAYSDSLVDSLSRPQEMQGSPREEDELSEGRRSAKSASDDREDGYPCPSPGSPGINDLERKPEAQDLSVKSCQPGSPSKDTSNKGEEQEELIEPDLVDEDLDRKCGVEQMEEDDDEGSPSFVKEEEESASSSMSSSSPASPSGFYGFYSPQQLMAASAAGYAGFPYHSFPLPSYLPTSQPSTAAAVSAAAAAALSAFTTKDNNSLMRGSGPHTLQSGLGTGSMATKNHRERQKRHRAFIDPVSEIPKLEQWFAKETHPSHFVIEEICEELNHGEFRSRYPKLSPKNIQLWFKNHRAKVKRMRVGQLSAQLTGGFDASLCAASPTGFYKPVPMANIASD